MDENKTYGTRLARLWKLFLSTLYISSFTFGGGFVIVTFMKKKFVDELHWIDEQEMLDMTALAQSSPGAIAVNAAILVGWQVEGLIGMIVAVLAPSSHLWSFFQSFLCSTMLLPPIAISRCYLRECRLVWRRSFWMLYSTSAERC